MTSLHRLIAIVLIWLVAGGVLITMFNIATLGVITLPGVLILAAIIMSGAAYGTGAVARAGAVATDHRMRDKMGSEMRS
ncbi:MAG: hypothetical protein HC822_12840 [Oscillochloris sp.]|nr:hypothetical protein [Oscillochloris sp.]